MKQQLRHYENSVMETISPGRHYLQCLWAISKGEEFAKAYESKTASYCCGGIVYIAKVARADITKAL